MITLTKIFCRFWQCATPGRSRDQAGPLSDADGDDLTVIRGIGAATRDRLYGAGIKSFTQLAECPPERIEAILGKMARGAKIGAWIEQAAELAKVK